MTEREAKNMGNSIKLEQLKGANGYKNTALDLSVLCHVMQEVWPQIQGKTRLTERDLDEGLRLSARLLRIVGLREQGPAQVAEASSQRQRAYTLLMIAYDHARRAVAFLRADADDADEIAPALHPGRPRSKKGGTAAPGLAVAAERRSGDLVRTEDFAGALLTRVSPLCGDVRGRLGAVS